MITRLPLSQEIQFIIPDSFSFLCLIVHNKLWILIKYGILSFGQCNKSIQHASWMNISRRSLHETINFSNYNIYVQVIPMVKKIL